MEFQYRKAAFFCAQLYQSACRTRKAEKILWEAARCAFTTAANLQPIRLIVAQSERKALQKSERLLTSTELPGHHCLRRPEKGMVRPFDKKTDRRH